MADPPPSAIPDPSDPPAPAPIPLTLPSNLLAALDTFMTTEALVGDGAPGTRPDAIRYILRDWLVGHGYLRRRNDPEGAN